MEASKHGEEKVSSALFSLCCGLAVQRRRGVTEAPEVNNPARDARGKEAACLSLSIEGSSLTTVELVYNSVVESFPCNPIGSCVTSYG